MVNGEGKSKLLDALDGSRQGLRVVFWKTSDRWQHAVEIVEGDEAMRVLESVEGDASESWPASPPLQSLSLETLADGHRAALLVGMSGTSHWSASVEALRDPPQLVFDIACRHPGPPERLGSAYRWLSASNRQLVLEPEAAETVAVSLPDAIIARPANVPPSPQTQTTRWKYVIRQREETES